MHDRRGALQRTQLWAVAQALRSWAAVDDSAPWLYAVLGRFEHAEETYVGGHAVRPRPGYPQPGNTIGFDFRTTFPWDRQYDGFFFELFGITASQEDDLSRVPREMLYPLSFESGSNPDESEAITLIVYCARVVRQGTPIFGRADWRPQWSRAEYSFVGVSPGRKNDAKFANEGLRLFANIPVTKRGPKPGTVEKFKTRADWHHAIREKVLSRQTLATANDDRIASWLGISTSLLYKLMTRWGPPRTLADLKRGNF